MAHPGLLIGDLAELAGMAPSALRYYEAAGLLEAEGRTESGYRVYGERAARRLLFIKGARSLGLKLSEIKTLIDAPRATRDVERTFFQSVIAAKIEETQSTIATLETKERQLRGLESALDAQPPPDFCHLGDCACWLPA
jgi:DNA-binding transcriptional MerR regulator